MSQLRQAMEQYLTVRRSLGFQLREAEIVLRRFVAFAEREGAAYITTDLVLRWTSESSKARSWVDDKTGQAVERFFGRGGTCRDPLG